MTERIYVGADEDLPEVMRALLALSADDPRAIVWLPEEYAVDVPDDVAAAYLKPKPTAAKKAAKTAKPTPPPLEE